MKTRFYLLIACLMLVSCIEEYKLSELGSRIFESEIVIQGKILSGDKTTIYVTRSQPVGSTDKNEVIQNAEITLIGENGYVSSKAEFDEENGRYVIPTYDLPKDTQYAIEVKAEGEVYMSNFQPILETPEIDDIHYKEKENGISLYVSANGKDNGSHHYMWTYDEDWEFHAEVDITKKVKGEWQYKASHYPLIDGDKNPYLYCWKHNESALINIYTTQELAENKVIDHEFLFIPIDDIRISYIYSILVKQACLSEEGYEYYRLMELYTQESSGMFTPIPNEIEGNVKCISDPKKKAYGYVMASDITTKRLFVYEADFKKNSSQYSECSPAYGYDQTGTRWKSGWETEVRESAAVIYNEKAGVIDNSSIFYSRICVNCLTIQGANKKRPDFWPNNHE